MVDLTGKKWCYHIITDCLADDGEHIPVLVIENEPGYYPMKGNGSCVASWKWGKDYNKACEVAKVMNKEMGVSEREAERIIGTSMRVSFQRN